MKWLDPILAQGAVIDMPGIYEWRIEGVGSYIGKFKHARRPLREYRINVEKLLEGRPYRPAKPDGFRRIHRALAQAVASGVAVELHILENPPIELQLERERMLIRERGNLNGRAGSNSDQAERDIAILLDGEIFGAKPSRIISLLRESGSLTKPASVRAILAKMAKDGRLGEFSSIYFLPVHADKFFAQMRFVLDGAEQKYVAVGDHADWQKRSARLDERATATNRRGS